MLKALVTKPVSSIELAQPLVIGQTIGLMVNLFIDKL